MMKPQDVDDVTLAFPARVGHLMPPEAEIPEQYWQADISWPCRLFNDLFFAGVKRLKLVPQEGIDTMQAWRHVRAIMGSFEPQHEYKEAACRYLLDQWFIGAHWE